MCGDFAGTAKRGLLYAAMTIPILVGIVSSSTPSHAGKSARQVTVDGGKTVGLRYYWRYRLRDCKPIKIVVKVVKEPEHGTLIRKAGMRDPRDADSSSGTNDGNCHGVKIPSVDFYYRAHKGYHGEDHVILRPVGFQGLGVNHHFRIKVK